MDALWSSQRNPDISTYHWPSIHWVRFRLCLHRRRTYCQIKSRRAQAQFSGCISASRFVRNHPKPREVQLYLNRNYFFGHRIKEHGIHLCLRKIKSIVDYPVLQSIKSLRQCLIMVTYYCRLIPNCVQILHPLTDLLKCSPKHFTMTPEAEVVFATMKQHISNATKLRYLSTTTEPQIVLKTDVSQVTVGGVLQQIINRKTQLLSFSLRKLIPHETW